MIKSYLLRKILDFFVNFHFTKTEKNIISEKRTNEKKKGPQFELSTINLTYFEKKEPPHYFIFYK